MAARSHSATDILGTDLLNCQLLVDAFALYMAEAEGGLPDWDNWLESSGRTVIGEDSTVYVFTRGSVDALCRDHCCPITQQAAWDPVLPEGQLGGEKSREVNSMVLHTQFLKLTAPLRAQQPASAFLPRLSTSSQPHLSHLRALTFSPHPTQ